MLCISRQIVDCAFTKKTFMHLCFTHQAVSCGMKALPLLLARGTDQLRYTSLCVPDDLKERGLDKLPNCYYAQDALRVWNALHRCF